MGEKLTCLSPAEAGAPCPSTYGLTHSCAAKSARGGTAYTRCNQGLGNTS